MKVVVVGATGNVGTSLLEGLVDDPRVETIVGVARRAPSLTLAKTTWVTADIARDDLTPHLRGADVVVHLAWVIQPSRDLETLRRINVEGSRRVFESVAQAEVPALVYASSVGAYAAGPKDRAVDESWSTDGIATSFYSRHKAEVERILDGFEDLNPAVRVVRLRPGLIFKREAASGIRRLFIGPFLPNFLVRTAFVPLVPDVDELRFQAVHSLDVGEAYRLAVVGDVRGPFNVAADPVIGPEELGAVFGARPVRVPPRLLRWGAAATWRLRLQPSPEGWVDMGYRAPIMDTSRARTELGWTPKYSSIEALRELLAGLRAGAGYPTPALEPDMGSLRVKELLTGLGKRGP
ncbi:MAG TPA: NAD-dependent epimerase/dehydratase family protein [Actinomycetota bacterium]|nr:NAD-dependent epimerase/dehydratase family protein [Actinomycetota bacterium]